MKTLLRIFPVLIIAIMSATVLNSQGINVDATGVAINKDEKESHASAILDIKSPNQGILIPRMDSATIADISTPAKGLLAYDTINTIFWFNDGTNWKKLNLWTEDGQDYILPGSDGTYGQLLSTDGDGNLTWITATDGDIIGVTAGSGLGGGGTSGSVSLKLGGTLSESTTITQGNYGMIYNLSGSGDFEIQDNGTRSFVIADDGKVGIGNLTPDAKLDIDGSVKLRSLSSLEEATSMLVVDASGTVGTSMLTSGDIEGVTAGSGLGGGGTSGSVSLKLGGTLSETTTITQGNYNMTNNLSGSGDMIYNLSSTGDFDIQDNGSSVFKVYDNGNIGLDVGSEPSSFFSIGTIGDSKRKLSCYNSSTVNGAQAIRGELGTPGSGSYHLRAINGTTAVGVGQSYGVVGTCYSASLTNGRAYGVYGQVGNATAGYNYGLYGYLSGSRNGAAVYGTIRGDASVPGTYAGYFNGEVYITDSLIVNGHVRASQFITNSDSRLKHNVTNLNSNYIQKIKQVQGVKYNLIQPSQDPYMQGDTLVTPYINQAKYNKDYIGFIAQDFQQLFPELVQADEDSYLCIDYVSFIPILTEAIKEQQDLIEILQSEVSTLKQQVQTLQGQ